MKREEATKLITLWVDRAKALHAAQYSLNTLLMASPEAPIFKAAWDMFTGYTKQLAEALGDEDGWMEWFAWECQLGEKPMEMSFANGEKLLVVGVDDLVDVILSDCDGNRVFESKSQVP